MILQPKFGSRINLSVLRANGRRDDYGDFYNHPLHTFLQSSGSVRGDSPGSLNFSSNTLSPISDMTGTWEQSGTTVSRVSGSGSLPNESSTLYAFANGTLAGWRTAGSGTSVTVSRSQTVAAQALYRFTTTIESANDNQIASVSSARNYADGVVTMTNSAPASFVPAPSAYILRSIRQSQTSYSSVNAVFININPPVSIGVGDVVLINQYEYKFDYGGHTPRAFAVSPITGLTGSGFLQRTRRITVKDNATAPTRIFLITDANKITLPDMFGPTLGTLLNPSSYTIAETITATGSVASSALANDHTESHSCFGTTAVGGTIKQIAWGTTTEIFGIIEYTTPVTIATGKVLTVGMSTRLNPVITLP